MRCWLLRLLLSVGAQNITSTVLRGEKFHHNLAPVLVILLWNSPHLSKQRKVFWKSMTKTNCPRKIFNLTRKTVWKTRKRTRKTVRNATEKCLALSGRLKIFHRPFSPNFKSFSPPKIYKKIKVFFTARLCRDGHANNDKDSTHAWSMGCWAPEKGGHGDTWSTLVQSALSMASAHCWRQRKRKSARACFTSTNLNCSTATATQRTLRY